MKTLKKTQNTSTSEHGKLAEEKSQKKNHSWKVQNSERDPTNSCASVANNYNSPKQIWSHWRKEKQRIVYLWNQILQKREDIECACHGMNLLAKHVTHGKTPKYHDFSCSIKNDASVLCKSTKNFKRQVEDYLYVSDQKKKNNMKSTTFETGLSDHHKLITTILRKTIKVKVILKKFSAEITSDLRKGNLKLN